MDNKETREFDAIKKNQQNNSSTGLVTQLLLHLLDKVSSLSTNSDKTQSEMRALNKRIDNSNKRTDVQITSATSRTEVKLIKWIVVTDIALAGVIIAAVHYFS